MRDIGDLHNTLSQTSYDDLLKSVLNKWKKDGDLTDFVEYFEKQWINSKFSNWQLFKVPVGFSMTNSPIESYNNKIKEAFTKRLKHHFTTAVEAFKDVISYESRNGKDFKMEIRVRKYMRDQAKTIIIRKQLIATNSESEYLYKHFVSSLGFARINISTLNLVLVLNISTKESVNIWSLLACKIISACQVWYNYQSDFKLSDDATNEIISMKVLMMTLKQQKSLRIRLRLQWTKY